MLIGKVTVFYVQSRLRITRETDRLITRTPALRTTSLCRVRGSISCLEPIRSGWTRVTVPEVVECRVAAPKLDDRLLLDTARRITTRRAKWSAAGTKPY